MGASGQCFEAWVKGLYVHLGAWRRLSNSDVVRGHPGPAAVVRSFVGRPDARLGSDKC